MTSPAQTHAAPEAELPSSGAPSQHQIDAFIEAMGMGLEAVGLQRAAGRMLAWLMVCDPPEQSAEQLTKALQASTGGVSTTVRMLTQLQLVERVGRAGERRAFYRVAPNVWDHAMAAQEQPTARLRAIADDGLRVLADTEPDRRNRLLEMRDYLAFIEREMPALRRRYHDEKGTAS
ncbi:transcriptional regulator [Agrococcus sp. ProA11]|uniref:GbsR/MarR family transcriptional regulator n=1 Tax=Agrococcus chionoecetis TaxID=3153752 RepID=UPI003260BC21